MQLPPWVTGEKPQPETFASKKSECFSSCKLQHIGDTASTATRRCLVPRSLMKVEFAHEKKRVCEQPSGGAAQQLGGFMVSAQLGELCAHS